MSLFSFLRKNKQEATSGESMFRSRAESQPAPAARKRSKRKSDQGAAPVDPVLPEKKRARRRLIGAIALVLAAVIGLPMVLDSEPKTLPQDIAIRIPSKDKAPLPEPSNPTNQKAPAETPKLPVTAALDANEEVIEPAEPSVAVGATPKHVAAVPSLPKEPVREKEPAKQTEPAKQAEPAKQKEPVKQRELVKEKEPVREREAAKEKEPVRSVETSKHAPAYPPSGIDSKPEAKTAERQQDEAMRVRALLEGRSDPKDAAEKRASKYVIQVAALATQEKVVEVQTRLKDAGIRSFTQKISTDGGERIRIRVGPFENKEEADKVRAKISKIGLSGTLIPA